MRNGRWLLASVMGLGLLGCTGEDVERYRIPVTQSPARWSDAAKVTIVEYSDYQCPFCGRAEDTLARIGREYGANVRLVWKDNPLPFHANAALAAEAARAAGAQGRFWEMHDLLLANQQKLGRADLESYAAELKLDVAVFKAALDEHRYKPAVDADIAEARNFGAMGTPTFFINGRPLRGALPFEQFKTVIDDEIVRAGAVVARGVAIANVYDELTRHALGKAAAPKIAAAAPPAQPQPDAKALAQLDIGRAPVRGEGKTTMYVFSDYQCPFCAKLEGMLKELPDVRIVWKNMPLPFHEHAELAAEAALAAGEQGKFWEMHDLLFANQQKLSREDLEGYAQKLGLDVIQFKSALDSHKYKPQIEDDIALAKKLGVRGTPTMVVNGKLVVGAQPLESIKAAIAGHEAAPVVFGDCKGGECGKN